MLTSSTPEFILPPALQENTAKIGIVLGSGLGPFVDSCTENGSVAFSEVAGLPVSTVPGHSGRFVTAELGGLPLLIAQGRVHLYEGLSASQITAGIRVMAQAGVETIILTNAAGSLNPGFSPGEWMMLSDHLNLTGTSPLVGAPNFVDISAAYDPEIREVFRETATTLSQTLHEGVYASTLGPQYETPAEIRMFRTLGADAIGMSTVLETIQARALGLKVAAFSCLTNWGAGLQPGTLDHSEVTATGKNAAGDFVQLLRAALPKLAG